MLNPFIQGALSLLGIL